MASEDPEWEAYSRGVWAERMDAHMRAVYTQRLRDRLHRVNLVLQWVVTLGSLGAVATLAGDQTRAAGIIALIVAACSAAIQVLGLPAREGKLDALIETANSRAAFWDDVWTKIAASKHAGTLQELTAGDAAVKRTLTEAWPEMTKLLVAAQEQVRKTDHIYVATTPARS